MFTSLALRVVAEREPSVKVFTEASGLEKSLKRTLPLLTVKDSAFREPLRRSKASDLLAKLKSTFLVLKEPEFIFNELTSFKLRRFFTVVVPAFSKVEPVSKARS